VGVTAQVPVGKGVPPESVKAILSSPYVTLKDWPFGEEPRGISPRLIWGGMMGVSGVDPMYCSLNKRCKMAEFLSHV
jgi:hypothetical protein